MKKLFAALFLLTAAFSFAQQNRYALVIGNANYSGNISRLPNTINDTNDISAALRNVGYNDVVLKQNLKRLDMIKEIDNFITKLRRDANSEGFFWYAGHAIEIGGESYLMPLDVELESDIVVRNTSYAITNLTDELNKVRNKANVLVLDACRTPPPVGGNSRSVGDRSRVIKNVPHAPSDLIVIYSTAPGAEALDGEGKRNSPFTEAFLKHINSPDPLTQVTTRITRETLSLTGQKQRPFSSGSITDEHYSLNPAGVRPSPTPSPQPSPTPQPTPNNFVRVEGGSFQMGSNNGDNSEKPVHTVTVKSFNMGKFPVTQKEYQEVMGTNPSNFKGDNRPVEQVSWYDAVEYCNRLSQKEGLSPAYTIDKSRSDPYNESEYDTVKWLVTWNRNANGYRLPTEAEWEYAAKGGNGSPGNYTYSGSNNIDEVAWYDGNSAGSTQAVGTKKPNNLGLYDMIGNVNEKCWDWYGDYSSSAQTDPVGAFWGSYRVSRGGDWFRSAQEVRSASRFLGNPSMRSNGGGFRLVRNAQ